MVDLEKLDVLELRIACPEGHRKLVECPLNERDWEEINRAYKAFLAVCRSVSFRAHKNKKEQCQEDWCRVTRGEWDERLARIAVSGNILPCPIHGTDKESTD